MNFSNWSHLCSAFWQVSQFHPFRQKTDRDSFHRIIYTNRNFQEIFVIKNNKSSETPASSSMELRNHSQKLSGVCNLPTSARNRVKEEILINLWLAKAYYGLHVFIWKKTICFTSYLPVVKLFFCNGWPTKEMQALLQSAHCVECL